MDHALLFQELGFLGLRLRYWVVIIIVILAIVAVAYFARGRSAI